jgi:hypothetical protein
MSRGWVGLANENKAAEAVASDGKAANTAANDDDKPPSIIAIDGKTMRGSKDPSKRTLHVVNAWCSENDLILGQTFVNEKSNIRLRLIPPFAYGSLRRPVLHSGRSRAKQAPGCCKDKRISRDFGKTVCVFGSILACPKLNR